MLTSQAAARMAVGRAASNQNGGQSILKIASTRMLIVGIQCDWTRMQMQKSYLELDMFG